MKYDSYRAEAVMKAERMSIQTIEISWENDIVLASVDAVQVFYAPLNGRAAADVVPQAEGAVAAFIHQKVLDRLNDLST